MKQAMRFILPAMLMAFGSAHAQAASPQQPPQPQQEPPSSQQMPQPSQPGQQEAPPMQVSAAQVASCGGAANKAITAMTKGDFNGATQAFNPKFKPTTDKLQQVWGALAEQYGNAKSIGEANKGQLTQGDVVVLVPMQFDKGTVGAEAGCDPGGQLVMLRFGQMPNGADSKS